jgi:hypothetical protein
MAGFFSTTFQRIWSRRTRSFFAKKKLQLFYSRPTAIISLKQNFSPRLKRVLKVREFYSAKEKEKNSRAVKQFFLSPVRKVGKIETLFECLC